MLITEQKCICTNQGKPDKDGLIAISPSCPVHGATQVKVRERIDPPTPAEIKEWKHRERA